MTKGRCSSEEIKGYIEKAGSLLDKARKYLKNRYNKEAFELAFEAMMLGARVMLCVKKKSADSDDEVVEALKGGITGNKKTDDKLVKNLSDAIFMNEMSQHVNIQAENASLRLKHAREIVRVASRLAFPEEKK